MIKHAWTWFWDRPKFWGKETTEQWCERVKHEMDLLPWEKLSISASLDGEPVILTLQTCREPGKLLIRIDDRLKLVIRDKYISIS